MNGIATISSFANTITTYQLPDASTLSRVGGATYSNLVESYGQVAQSCYLWLEGVEPLLNALPQVYVSLNPDVQSFFTSCLTDAAALQQNPGDQAAQQDLQQQLSLLTSHIQGIQDILSATSGDASEYAGTLENNVGALQTALQDVSTLYNDVESDIASLQAQISTLNSKIAALQVAVPAAEVTTGMGLMAFALRIPLLMSWNPVAGGILLIAGFIGASIAMMEESALNQDIQNLQATLQAAALDQTQDIQSVSALLAAQGTIQGMLVLAQSLTAPAGPFTQIAQVLEQFVTQMQQSITDLAQAAQDDNGGQITQTITDLQGALSAWNQDFALAQSLQQNVNVSVDSQTLYVVNNGAVTTVPHTPVSSFQ
ncbi:hypothetical protein EMM73_19295 [Rheinheimera sediminis]|uniref:HBL/NHE enterotoxin family protein n=1 Tax=Rheinheimera sp. YQF-1 TaxID=2499626 RepID=UPI000FD9BF10|nr:HBL/NHE enterotoxin family protein [Rheinheimera sp. YQF-1]RVT41373.1 hypothetical protein EMM73_19295 [Rheinheimera sp. YQF-1]